MANEDAKERIRTLFPGDENKGLRHALFSLPDFLKSDPSDEEILEQARLISGDSKPDPTPEVAEENPTSRIKEVLAPEAEAKLVHKQAAELTSGDLPTVIETAEEYQKASLLFASGKKMLKDNEAKRKKLKAPILEAGQRIDDEFKAAADTIHALIDPIEFRMNTFKQKERDALREQEATRARLIREAEAEAQAQVDKATAHLNEVAESIPEADPLMAAFLADDLDEAKEEIRTARRDLNSIPDKVFLPEAIAPVTAVGSRVSYPLVWEITNPEEVPRNLCSPDSVKLNALMKILRKDFPDITKLEPGAYPGLKITEQIRIGGR